MRKDCLICGTEFTPNSATSKYCSSYCRREKNRQRKYVEQQAHNAVLVERFHENQPQ